eukprot:scaffold259415_cov37-Tisochrysis_lutea.AAC.1
MAMYEHWALEAGWGWTRNTRSLVLVSGGACEIAWKERGDCGDEGQVPSPSGPTSGWSTESR